MASENRLRGQEMEIRFVRNGNPELTITAVSSFEDTLKFEKSQDGFLGEVTDRYDNIFKGVDGKLEFQVSNASYLQLQTAIKLQAQRKQPDTVINIIRTDYFANGETAILTYPDCKFGPMPTTAGSRADFVKVSTDFSCSDRDDQTLNGAI